MYTEFWLQNLLKSRSLEDLKLHKSTLLKFEADMLMSLELNSMNKTGLGKVADEQDQCEKLLRRSERRVICGGRKGIILLEGSETLPARPYNDRLQ